jgi:hypothetical protein
MSIQLRQLCCHSLPQVDPAMLHNQPNNRVSMLRLRVLQLK